VDDISFEVNARMSVEEFENKLNVKLCSGDEAEDFDTLGGLIFYMLGHVPAKGEVIKHESGIEFEVIEADPRRVSRLLVRKRHP
jgi:magnesium and cobalt transporter